MPAQLSPPRSPGGPSLRVQAASGSVWPWPDSSGPLPLGLMNGSVYLGDGDPGEVEAGFPRIRTEACLCLT